MNKITFISSDGHATARMEDYRPYLESRYHAEFDEFLPIYQERGSRNFDPPALRQRIRSDEVDKWITNFIEPGRLEGCSDPDVRLRELDQEGIAAEVLFPDFGLPFELYVTTLASSLRQPPRTQDKIDAGNRAYNRWLVDFTKSAPSRFAGMAAVTWTDVDAAIREIRWAKEAGLKGVVLPMFDPGLPLYHEMYDPIWDTLEDLEMVANSHMALSSTSNEPIYTPHTPHPACQARLFKPKATFYCHEILHHLIWGGVLERHPNLKVVFTEQGSGWVVQELREMDFVINGSFFRPDINEVVPLLPSEYFSRQCFLGSSTFSREEVEARHSIGVDKMMIGADYPHHEGMMLGGIRNYLQATFGTAGVSFDESRMMLGETAARVFGFDLPALAAEQVALSADEILKPPEVDLFPRGDVRRPVSV
jgi:predicted TIM-barrel fold metal-dependent hydrolase